MSVFSKPLSPQAALHIVQETRPYAIQVRDSTKGLWRAFVGQGNQPVMMTGKQKAYQELASLREQYPSLQFRVMPKPESDSYLAGVRDAERLLRREGKEGHGLPLLFMPDNI